MSEPLAFAPLVIVGAARSGTNLMRDMIARLPGYGAWPCDEAPSLWRHGNAGVPHDALTAGHARGEVRAALRRAMTRAWRRAGRPPVMVEKTCANTLRLGFVHAVLPEARYLFVLRDGRAVVPSAMRRWRGETEMSLWPYLARKVRAVPPAELPREIWGCLRRRAAGGGVRAPRWGPWPEGFERHLGEPLDLVCARQWALCVEASGRAARAVPQERRAALRYEDVLRDPVAALGRAAALAGAVPGRRDIAQAAGLARPPCAAPAPLRPEVESVMAPARAIWRAA